MQTAEAFRAARYIPGEKNTAEGGESERRTQLVSHVTDSAQCRVREEVTLLGGGKEEGQSCKRIRFQQAMRSFQLMLLGQIVTSYWFVKTYIQMSKEYLLEGRRETVENIFQPIHYNSMTLHKYLYTLSISIFNAALYACCTATLSIAPFILQLQVLVAFDKTTQQYNELASTPLA